jgi:3-hydroxyisobutyrate dehydrogenase-like beta-hydroxyacid dehydrogenase
MHTPPEIKTIGFIGLGIMGNSMAGHLLAAG